MPTKSKYQRLKEEGKCPDCEQELESQEFIYCSKCRAKRSSINYARENGKWEKPASFICQDCSNEFSLKDSHQQVCRTCKRIRSLDQHYRNRYKITYVEVMKLFDIQKGKCAICFKVLDKPGEGHPLLRANMACVDHNHKTGLVRGILCNRCNTKLGAFNEDELNRLIKYIS
jgi:Zn finger protein HypA/HybF involved in hydrogenase expression